MQEPNPPIYQSPEPVVPAVPVVPDAPPAIKSKLPLKWVFVILGVFVFLLLAVLALKLISGSTQPTHAKIVWWSLEEDADAAAPLISAYEQNNPNVTIQFVKQSPQDYRERLASSLQKGDGPDIFEYHNSWVPNFINDLSPTKDDYSQVLYPVAVSNLKSANGFLGVPLEYDGIALFINQDIFNAYGKSAPKTWDDLRKIAGDLTVRDQTGNIKQAGVALGTTSNIDYWQDILAFLMLQNGADLTKPSTALGQSALTFYTNFSKTDHDWNDTLPNSTIDFAQGKLAMYFGKYSDVFAVKQQNPNLNFEVVPLPQLPQTGVANQSTAYASYWVNGVWNKSSNPLAAWSFLKFMMNNASLQQLYQNEKKVRGYGNLYPRVDMQTQLLTDPNAGPFIYQASFAKSWYLYDKTNDGATGINTQIAKPYSDAINAVNTGNTTSDKALQDAQSPLTSVLASFGLVAAPLATTTP